MSKCFLFLRSGPRKLNHTLEALEVETGLEPEPEPEPEINYVGRAAAEEDLRL